VYPALGLAGEAGEYVDKVKKTVRDIHVDKEDMALELGDVLWYLAVSAQHLGFDLSTIVEMNMAKLNRRREQGKIQGQGDHR
jgi:NTP pyrophosphatase (non-canonical NTP hydrolase)